MWRDGVVGVPLLVPEGITEASMGQSETTGTFTKPQLSSVQRQQQQQHHHISKRAGQLVFPVEDSTYKYIISRSR